MNTRFAPITGRPHDAVDRARKARNDYVLRARYARAEEREALDRGEILINRRPVSYWVGQARRHNRTVLFELAWRRANGA